MSSEEIAQIFDIVSHCKNCGQCSLTCPPHFFGLFNPLGVLHDEGLKCGALVKKVQWYSLGDATKGSKYYNFALGKKNVITELKHNEKLRERLKELIDGSTNN